MEDELDLSNYAPKANFKIVTGADISEFPKKTDLANLNSYVDELDVGKLVPVSVDLSKLSDVVKIDVVKKR